LEAADKNVQIAAEPGYTGTNAHYIEINADHIPTGLISLPIRYMHTCSETARLSDCESVARLIKNFVENGNFISSEEEINA